jgi:hypothetical protein
VVERTEEKAVDATSSIIKTSAYDGVVIIIFHAFPASSSTPYDAGDDDDARRSSRAAFNLLLVFSASSFILSYMRYFSSISPHLRSPRHPGRKRVQS